MKTSCRSYHTNLFVIDVPVVRKVKKDMCVVGVSGLVPALFLPDPDVPRLLSAGYVTASLNVD